MSSVLPPNSKPAHLATVDRPVADRTGSARVDTPSVAPNATPAVSEVKLSPAVETALREAEFDHVKVEQLKSAIAAGNYPLDLEKVADNFLPLERLL